MSDHTDLRARIERWKAAAEDDGETSAPAGAALLEAVAAIERVVRLCDLTIAASCRVQAIDQAKDTLAALGRFEEPRRAAVGDL